MATGTYTTKDGELVAVFNRGDGHYLIRYTDGRVTVV